jgi:hypothetical protein
MEPTGNLDATPSKRVFLSIMADYDLNTAICELIDNALDIWMLNGKKDLIKINIETDLNQQRIIVSDNAGGVSEEELEVLVSPGRSTNDNTQEIIGIFGVGTKRAVIALSQDIKITTRHNDNQTFAIIIDENWLASEDWKLPKYKTDSISTGSTLIEMQRLRLVLDKEKISDLENHIAYTYAHFLSNSLVDIRLNNKKISPMFFEQWSFPPDYTPKKQHGTMLFNSEEIKFEIMAGLSEESSASGDYGVYFYCNERLIAKAVKDYDVGFTKGVAGMPHPLISLMKVIVNLNGKPHLMPWNSSKSNIDYKNPVFSILRKYLLEVVKTYSSLSRRLSTGGGWPETVYKYKIGKIDEIDLGVVNEDTKLYLPILPKSKPRYADLVERSNKSVIKNKPWAKGLCEGIVAADLIFKQKNMEQKNRISLIILDSTLEIAFKEYLVNDSGNAYGNVKLLNIFNNRHEVHKEIKNCKDIKISDGDWKKIVYFYNMRCNLVHEKSSVGINDNEIQDMHALASKILNKLFKLKLNDL